MAGDVVDIEILPRPPLRAAPEEIPLDVLYEDEDVIVVNKPAGMVVHAGAGGASRNPGERAAPSCSARFQVWEEPSVRELCTGSTAAPPERWSWRATTLRIPDSCGRQFRSRAGEQDLSGIASTAGWLADNRKIDRAANLARSSAAHTHDGATWAWPSRTDRLARPAPSAKFHSGRSETPHGTHAPNPRALCRRRASPGGRYAIRCAASSSSRGSFRQTAGGACFCTQLSLKFRRIFAHRAQHPEVRAPWSIPDCANI